MKKYDYFISLLYIDYETFKMKNKNIYECSKFLEENKNTLSEYQLGKAYLELQSCSNKIEEAYKYYKLAEKYLTTYDFELIKINLNNFYDFCNILIQNGDQKVLSYFPEILNVLLEFYKTYGNFSKDEVELMMQINIQQKINDELIIESEKLKKYKDFQQIYN